MNSQISSPGSRETFSAKTDLVDRGNCPLCGSKSRSIQFQFGPIGVARCAQCSFMFSDRLMPNNVLREYYRDGFGSERHRKGQLVNAVTNTWALCQLLKDQLRGRSILDVGTGYGYLLADLHRRFSMKVTGIELSKQEASFAKDVLGVNVINSALVDSGLQPASFDVVSCFEVIEHVDSPRRFIDELKSYLKPDGIMIVMTDNFSSKPVQIMGTSFPKWIPHSHISHFDASTLRRTMEESGFKILRSLSFTPWEIAARAALTGNRGPLPSVADFDLERILETEMAADFRFFTIRRWLNSTWARMTYRDDLEGSLMYVAARPVK